MKVRQTGLSLIEILVAMFLGVMVLGGLAGVFLANRTSWEHAYGTARIQDEADFILSTVRRILFRAGFRNEPWHSPGGPLGLPEMLPFKAGQAVWAYHDSATGGDVLVVRSHADISPPTMICGLAVNRSGNDNVFMRLRLKTGAPPSSCGDTVYELVCDLDDNPAFSNNLSATLSDAVNGFRVKLGIDQDGDYVADRYLDPAAVSDFNRIVSVKLGYVVSSKRPFLDSAATWRVDPFDTSGTPNSDVCMHEQVVTEIALRNVIP